MTQKELILASSSKYRRELLGRLKLKFSCELPQVDESPKAGELPQETCIRLARAKAYEVAQRFPDAVVIGSDQVADFDGEAISKPGCHDKARSQLRAMSGRKIVFHTAVCVVCQASDETLEFSVPTEVHFRSLTAPEIERYLIAEEPYDCAGSAKSEGLGITLLDKIKSDDPTALIGLPLIELSKTLRLMGLVLP